MMVQANSETGPIFPPDPHEEHLNEEYGSFEIGRGLSPVLDKIHGTNQPHDTQVFVEDIIPREQIKSNLSQGLPPSFQPLENPDPRVARSRDRRGPRRTHARKSSV